jgi:WD40 repeat protein
VVTDEVRVQIFDLAQWKRLGLLQPPSSLQMRALAFSRDGTRLVAACAKGRVRVWDLRRIREQLATFNLGWDLPPPPAPSQPQPRLRMRVAR